MTVLFYDCGAGRPANYEQYRGDDPVPGAIASNAPLDDVLHVVAVLSNPCRYRRRWQLALDFFERMEATPHVALYVVELAYGDEPHVVTSADNARHLQLRTETPIWAKETMINVGVRTLLPPDWKAFAWIDADVEFVSPGDWALDALKVLNGAANVVQLFSIMMDLDARGDTMRLFQGAGMQYVKNMSRGNDVNFWHPGYAWAMTRELFEATGGVLDTAIMGSGDNLMFAAWTQGSNPLNAESSRGYMRSYDAYLERCVEAGVRVGYIPHVLQHHFHGSKKNRGYDHRWKLLVKHDYDPDRDLETDASGLLVAGPAFPEELKAEIMRYFGSRNEDEV